MAKVSRRKFIVRAALGGTGVLLGGTYLARGPIRRTVYEYANSAEMSYMGPTKDPMMWFEVTEANQVIFHCPKVEMGQGSHTGLAQIAADELEIEMDQIRVVHAATDTGNIDFMSTGGSTSVAGLWQPLRELSATMRQMLVEQAAVKMGVLATTLNVAKGVISDGNQSMTYGEVVKDVTEWKVPKTPELKPMSKLKHVGKPVPRVDLVDKVMGAPIFGMDAQIEGMLYGAVARPDVIGATFNGVDISAAEGMPGVVKIIVEDDFAGVVARTRMEAENAKNALKVNWATDRVWQTEDIEEMIKVGAGEPRVIQTKGKAEKILKDEEGLITAEFTSPLGAHAQLEPNGAVADVRDGKATIILSTQVVRITREEVAKRLGIKKDDVNIVPTFLGGGFGRRLHTPNAMHAAVMSQRVGAPVKAFFNRKEEFQNDTFRPPTHHTLKAKLKEDGMIEAIEHNVSSGDVMFGSALSMPALDAVIGADIGAWRGGMIQYRAIPNFRAVSWRVKLPFATSFWRSLGLLANTFAIESFMDELALKAGMNPVEYRLAQIQDDEAGERLRNVIKTCADKAGYTDEVRNGRAMGFAASTDAATPVAQVAEVSIEGKKIKVHKVTLVMDPGVSVNPDQVKAQCEGCVCMGISAALHERMYVNNGSLQPTIYGPYDMALLRDVPKEIDVTLLQGIDKPGPVGEPPLGPVAAAIANAVFRLTGERLRSLPLQLS